MKLKTLIVSLAWQHIKEVGVVSTQETSQYIECTCKIQWYTIFMLSLIILGSVHSTPPITKSPLMQNWL